MTLHRAMETVDELSSRLGEVSKIMEIYWRLEIGASHIGEKNKT